MSADEQSLRQTQQIFLKQTQQLLITPKMQLALSLLQAPVLELHKLIQQELARNPVLEEESALQQSTDDNPSREDLDVKIESLQQFEEDTVSYSQLQRSQHYSTPEEEERRQYFFETLTKRPTLSEHLQQQLYLATSDPTVRQIGELIIGNLDENGYLQASLEEIAQSTQTTVPAVEKTLLLVQTFHPSGVAARDLQECLLVQLDRLGKSESLEAAIVANHLGDLAHHNYEKIARALKVHPQQVQQAAQFISALEPRPGRAFRPDSPQEYIVPEVFVTKNDGQWQVTVNDSFLPRLKISNKYKDLLVEAGQNEEARAYLREKIRQGNTFIELIHQRQETLRKIAQEIFRRQQDFLEEGIMKLHPLRLTEVAAAVGVHETTVSRAVANKYVQTPHGIFELKFFFTPGYRTSEGDISNKAVKEMLVEILSKEDPKNPLSDEKIAQIFTQKGINLSRRTVAKYRAELKILPVSLRRKR